jgi:3-oxoacyl-[acyl-carrier protein] reductase
VRNRFHGRTALVTGASRGIGAAVALLLAEQGADVAINFRSKGSRAEDAAAIVDAAGDAGRANGHVFFVGPTV